MIAPQLQEVRNEITMAVYFETTAIDGLPSPRFTAIRMNAREKVMKTALVIYYEKFRMMQVEHAFKSVLIMNATKTKLTNKVLMMY